MRTVGVAIALAIAVVVGAAAPARAQDEAQYRQHVREALEEFEAGNFQEALTLFQQAYAIRPTARVLRGIAKVRFELRQYVECVEAAEAAMASQNDALTPEMQHEMTELRDRALRFVGTLVVRVDPPGATVLLDGRQVPPAQIGTPIRVAMGSHTVEATAAERQDAHRTVDVQGGQTAEVALTLEAIAAPVREVIVQQAAPPPPPPPPHQDIGLMVAGFVLEGIGAAALGVGIAWLVDRQGAVDRCQLAWVTDAVCRNEGTVVGERDLSIIPLAAGGAVLATGVILTIVHFTSSGGGDEAQPTALCVPTGDGVMCAGGARW